MLNLVIRIEIPQSLVKSLSHFTSRKRLNERRVVVNDLSNLGLLMSYCRILDLLPFFTVVLCVSETEERLQIPHQDRGVCLHRVFQFRYSYRLGLPFQEFFVDDDLFF